MLWSYLRRARSFPLPRLANYLSFAQLNAFGIGLQMSWIGFSVSYYRRATMTLRVRVLPLALDWVKRCCIPQYQSPVRQFQDLESQHIMQKNLATSRGRGSGCGCGRQRSAKDFAYSGPACPASQGRWLLELGSTY